MSGLERHRRQPSESLRGPRLNLEEDLVLAFELNFLVVELPGQQHVPVRANELVGR